MRRRDFARMAGALAAFGAPKTALLAVDKSSRLKKLDSPQPFDYAWLKGRAQWLRSRPYQKPAAGLPDEVAALDWDAYQAIGYRNDHALWGDDNRRFRVKFFHLGLYYGVPVRMHELVDGMAQELAYDPEMFDYGKSGLHAMRMPPDLGFAGFRVNFHSDWRRDVAVFLGASYFRAIGGEPQYGLSARGLAIDAGGAEEFPLFTDFWFEKPAAGADTLTVYALMDSPSVTGAYRFDIRPADRLVMDVDAALYPRKDIERVGIAPLTSMFQHGENDRRRANDWRPEIHDSDGLSMWAGTGEWLWRPLANPEQVRFSAFSDEDPRGFGLLQRDREFDHYQDDGAFYERRPSLWVEPKAGWGKGTIQLVELPTDDETNDNIVAFWTPAAKPRAGEERLFSYRLHWSAKPPVQPPGGRVAATRTGIGGVVGRKRTYVSWRFAVDFEGGDLSLVGDDVPMTPVIASSRGTVEIASARPLRAIRGYRAMFDLRLPDEKPLPVELRLYLACQGQAMSETWCWQWTPPAAK